MPRRYAAIVGLLVCVLIGSLAPSCRSREPAPLNLLLITIDTLRADRLGAWGYGAQTSPSIDALAADSSVFLSAQSHSSWTLPSLATLLTSLHSSTHRCWHYLSRLDESFVTLPELLGEAGFLTAGIGSHTFLGEKFGLLQGFEEFDDELVRPNLESHLAVSSRQVTAKASAWLRAHARDDRPWFLWVHYFDPHTVYQAHAGVSEHFGTETDSNLYDGEIAFTDAAIGDLISKLDELELAETTIVALTSDHGEEFGEHGDTEHGNHLHWEVLRVPLLFRVPGLPGRRIETRVELVDVLPTLLELLELPVPEAVEGRSLVPAMRGEPLPSRPLLSEVRLRGRYAALEAGRWKLIRRPGTVALYDLSRDPGEQVDVAAENRRVVARLQSALDREVSRAVERGRDYAISPILRLGEDELRALKALGYTGEDR